MKKILFIIVMAAGFSGYSQVGVGTSNPDASAQLDVVSTNKGVLVPRVQLTGSSDIATIASPKESLLVYNTATAGDVIPGFYYWNAVKWVSLSGGLSGNVSIANGGTGATTAAGALINLGAQAAGNLTTTLGSTADHYPSENAVKIYVDSETTRATNVELGLQTAVNLKAALTDVSAENTRATAAEGILQNSVTNEITRATAAEATETTRATTAETGLQTAIAAETTRATTAEALKEVLSNKAVAITTQTTDDAYPSVKAVKAYVDAAPSFYGTDGTLAGARVVTQNNNDLTFNTGTGNFNVNGNLHQGGGVFAKCVITIDKAFMVPNTISSVVFNGDGAAIFTLPDPIANPGMELKIFNISGFSITFPASTFYSTISNMSVFPGAAGVLVSDGKMWNLLLGTL